MSDLPIKKKCPSCQGLSVYGEHAHFPFCSARCRDRDFLAWTDEARTLSTPLVDAENSMDNFSLSDGVFPD
ncbi:MAG: DNA gyrase inhibitor YacG [Planctomycetes bacterium]|nr:DNA gyrase inhibitor YacG [Planctomycetota bacterium]